MSRTRVLLALVPGVALAVGAVAQEPLTIHLKAGTARETTAQEDKALEAKFRAAQKAFDEVEKAAAEVAMQVGAGGRLEAATLAKSGAVLRAKKSGWSRAGAFTVHDFSADAPYWVLISRKPQIGLSYPWKGSAGQAADAFERFAAEYGTRIATARTTAK